LGGGHVNKNYKNKRHVLHQRNKNIRWNDYFIINE